MNIVAISTAYGTGGISVVRLSGPNALRIASHITQGELKPRFAHLKKLNFNGEFLDEAIVIYFKSPKSFTGEDVVEFHTHGGFVVANLLVEALVKCGARLALPGEFSKRAFINGKMNASKAENIAALINAKSEGAAKILARTLTGELGIFCETLRTELLQILAATEVCIDYAEDDLPQDVLQRTAQKLATANARLLRIVELSRSRRGLIDGYKVAIIGRPNVGKSSILNALLAFERAIVSDIAGTTRDTISESVKIGTHLVKLIDTAGIRSSSGIEALGIELAKKSATEADILLCVFDGSSVSQNEDVEILEFVKSLDKKKIFLLNKSDLACKFDLTLESPVKISAKNDINSLKKTLENYLNSQETSEIMLTTNRQIEACEAAQNALVEAGYSLESYELDIFAFWINTALKKLGEITTPPQNSELLEKMFSEFCLGK